MDLAAKSGEPQIRNTSIKILDYLFFTVDVTQLDKK